MPEKRGLDNGTEHVEAKRTRFDAGPPVAASAASTVEKAQRLLQLASKLKRNPKLQALKAASAVLPNFPSKNEQHSARASFVTVNTEATIDRQ